MNIDIHRLCQIAETAGDRILEIYRDEDRFQQVDWKDDQSPLTLADREANDLIEKELHQCFPGIPVLSEEGSEVDYGTRKNWGAYFLVDPLDGTKEFINRNGEFTVNIALVENRLPTLGVVHAPVLKKTYFGRDKAGAFLKTSAGTESIHVNSPKNECVAVRSKSHASPEEESVLSAYNSTGCVSVGSSLKFCLVADGTADLYYRHGPTMEWDVAAGQAVVQAAGGKVFAGTGPEPFLLNKENLLNGSFLCVASINDQANT